MLPTVRQIALSLYASSRRVERLPRVDEFSGCAWFPSRGLVAHETFSLACLALGDDSQTTESVFAELSATV